MLVNPFRNTWVVAKDFVLRGVEMKAGTVFRVRTLHLRVWSRLINDGSLVKKEDFVAEPKQEEVKQVEEVITPKTEPTKAPVDELIVKPKKTAKPKKAKPKKTAKPKKAKPKKTAKKEK